MPFLSVNHDIIYKKKIIYIQKIEVEKRWSMM